MAKRFFGYVDSSNNPGPVSGFIQSAGVAEFDTNRMEPFYKKHLEYYEKGTEDGEEILETIYPSKVYFSIDNFSTNSDGGKYSTKLVGEGDWPVNARDVYKTLSEAWAQIYKSKKLIFQELFESER